MEVKIGFGNLRPEAIRVVDLHLAPIPQVRAQFVGCGFAIQQGHEEALRVLLHHLASGPADHNGRGVCVREERPHFPARLVILLADRMRSQDAERIPMIAIDYRFNFFASHENL